MTGNPATGPTGESADDRDGAASVPDYQPTRPIPARPYQRPPAPAAYPPPHQGYLPQPAPQAFFQSGFQSGPMHPGAGGNLGGPPSMRASSADRERAVDICKASYGEGRLTKEEFDERVSQIHASRTYGDLAALIYDLPAGPLGGISHYQAGGFPVPAARPQPAMPRPTNGLAVGSLVCSLLFLSLPAVIMGHIARSQIKERDQAGDGIAVAGLVIGWLGVALYCMLILIKVASGHG